MSKLISQSYLCGQAGLNATAREKPTGGVSVPHQQKLPVGRANNSPNDQCHTSPNPEINIQNRTKRSGTKRLQN
jgi:hypothetical protein